MMMEHVPRTDPRRSSRRHPAAHRQGVRDLIITDLAVIDVTTTASSCASRAGRHPRRGPRRHRCTSSGRTTSHRPLPASSDSALRVRLRPLSHSGTPRARTQAAGRRSASSGTCSAEPPARRSGPARPRRHPVDEHVWTAAELLTDAERVAAGLLTRPPPGTRIATGSPNGPEAILHHPGVALAGMVLVPINPRSAAGARARARLSAAAAIYAAEDAGGNPQRTSPPRAGSGGCRTLGEVYRCTGDWRALMSDEPTSLPDVDRASLAQIQSPPAPRSGEARRSPIRGWWRPRTRSGAASASPRCVDQPMPLFHTAGNVLGVMGALWQSVRARGGRFEAGPVLALLEERRATVLSAAPTLRRCHGPGGASRGRPGARSGQSHRPPPPAARP